MSTRLLLWSLTFALAGFLFGFDTVVISGAEKTIQTVWSVSDELHGLAMGPHFVEAFPASIYTALCFAIPESPRWLIGHAGNS